MTRGRGGVAALVAIACMAALGAEAREPVAPALRSTPPVQLVQTCTCQNPVGVVGQTTCHRQRIVRCRGTTQNLCDWQETNERC